MEQQQQHNHNDSAHSHSDHSHMSGVPKEINDFLRTRACLWHSKKRPQIVCLDYFCENKGLICATCLTIKGNHKGHDSLEIGEFLEQINEKFAQSTAIDDEFLRESDARLKQNISSIRTFQAEMNTLIDSYIEAKQAKHIARIKELHTSKLIKRCRTADFANLEEFNAAIKLLSTKLKYKSDQTLANIEADSSNQGVENQHQNVYLEDLASHKQIVDSYLMNDILSYLKEKVFSLATIKQSPSYFYQPLYLSEKNLSLQSMNGGKSSPSKQQQPDSITPPAPNANLTSNPQIATFKGFYENQELIYIGELHNLIPHGKGLAYYRQTNKIYEGDFYQGKLHGKGRIVFSNGDSFVGDFHMDHKQGRGIYRWQSKKNYYEGEFWNSKRHGQGLFISGDGSRYEGNFKEGNQSGYGVLRKQNGKIDYEGLWSNGCFEGRGIQYLENGDKFNGEFSQDMFNGRGVYTKKVDNTEIHGIWKSNELVIINQTVQLTPLAEDIVKAS